MISVADLGCGVRDTRPSQSIFFHFHGVISKHYAILSLWEILDPPLEYHYYFLDDACGCILSPVLEKLES